jgi:MFS family permease
MSRRPPAGSRPLPHTVSFWFLAALLALFLFAAAAPSPLYVVYEARWHFSSVTLTAVFAVYAMALLVALLTTGRLSDHLGRRPVVAAALVVQVASMAAFLVAEDVAMLYVARSLQGLATGLATGAITAWLLDLEPSSRPGLGSVAGGIAPMVGLASGALFAGLLVQYGPDPLRLVYWLLAGIYAAALPALLAIEDAVERRPGWLASMAPEIGVPAAARGLFLAATPSLIATWALGGLYLSLGPSLAISLLGTDSHVAGGLVILALAGTGAVLSVLVRSTDPGLLLSRGSWTLLAGVAITLLSIATGSVAILYVGSVVAGAGFGPAFSGIFRSLAPLAPPDERSALIASIYIVSYLAFSLPAVIGGIAVSHYGLADATYAYGGIVIVLAASTATMAARGNARAAEHRRRLPSEVR